MDLQDHGHPFHQDLQLPLTYRSGPLDLAVHFFQCRQGPRSPPSVPQVQVPLCSLSFQLSQWCQGRQVGQGVPHHPLFLLALGVPVALWHLGVP